MARSFREACCEKLGIPEESFEETVLWQCLPPRYVLVGKLRWRFDRAYFQDDLELIHWVADCTSLQELSKLEHKYHRFVKPISGFQRRVLRARLSGQRLVDFAHKFIPPQ
jgi:hypothetical protein